jgi:acetolactate synthase-1/2/3 large subunit
MKCSVNELIFRYLEAAGVEYIFGIPGMTLEPFLITCRKYGRVTPVLAKHEEGAAFMADGYARVKGTLGACFGTSGPGVTNLISGVATAYADEVPVVVFTGQIPTFTNRKGTLQDSTGKGIDSVQLFHPVCKSSSMLLSRYSAQYDLEQALCFALTGKRGPVHISLPKDIQTEEIDVAALPSGFVPLTTEYFDRKLVIDAARELVNAECPAILMGSGAMLSGASADIRDLAEMLQVPVATTPRAKGAFPENHPLSLGVLGLSGSPLADEYIKSGSIDVLLVIGASLNQITTLSWDPRIAPSRCLIHVNIDPTAIGVNYRADISLIGDARTIVNEISFRVLRDLESAQVRIAARSGKVARTKEQVGMFLEPEKMDSEAVPLKPQRLMRDLQECLPDDAILFSDVGNNLLWTLHYLKMCRPGSYVAPFGLLTMGYATAAAIGGKLAAPDRPVIANVGDGCFFMNGMEVATAVTYDIPVVWIVHNNAQLGLIHTFQSFTLGEDTILTRFRRADFAGFAEALGANGYVVERPGELKKVLPDAIAAKKPAVIDCIIDPDEKPPVSSFVKGAKDYVMRTLL